VAGLAGMAARRHSSAPLPSRRWPAPAPHGCLAGSGARPLRADGLDAWPTRQRLTPPVARKSCPVPPSPAIRPPSLPRPPRPSGCRHPRRCWPSRLGQDPVVVEVRHAHRRGSAAAAPVSAFRGFPATGRARCAARPRLARIAGGEVEFIAADGYRSAGAGGALRALPRLAGAISPRRWRPLRHRQPAPGPPRGAARVRGILVWTTSARPPSMHLGDHYWPYQVVELRVAAWCRHPASASVGGGG
jgi:hypothetical protein